MEDLDPILAKSIIAKRLAKLNPDDYGGLVKTPEDKAKQIDLAGDFQKMNTYEDTGREKGLADTLMVPQAIAKRYLDKVVKGKGFFESIPESIQEQIGRDPESAPKYADTVSEMGVKNPYVGAAAATVLDLADPMMAMGMKAPGVTGTIEKKALPKILQEIDTAEKAVALKGAEREAYLKALDETFGSRAERMKQMGFDEPIQFHGTSEKRAAAINKKGFDINAPKTTDEGYLGAAAYATPQKFIAKAYAEKAARQDLSNPIILELLSGSKNKEKTIYSQDFKKNIADLAQKYGVDIKPEWTKTKSGVERINREFSKELTEKLKNAGVQSTEHLSPQGELIETAIYDTSKIRSPSAAFDPRFADSPLLLAGQTGLDVSKMTPEQLAIALRLKKQESAPSP